MDFENEFPTGFGKGAKMTNNIEEFLDNQDINGNELFYDEEFNPIIVRYAGRELLPKGCQKYWAHKESLFSRFDEGIKLTSELWYSVTPENIAKHCASYVFQHYNLNENTGILDVFAGGGGNSIQFANYCNNVVAIDLKADHLFCLEENAKLYQVDQNITALQKDWTAIDDDYLLALKNDYNIDFIFSSPPWGGPKYLKKPNYDLERNLKPFSLTKLLMGFIKITKNIGLFLPRNSDLSQLNEITKNLFGEDSKCFVADVSLNGRKKGYCCFWNDSTHELKN